MSQRGKIVNNGKAAVAPLALARDTLDHFGYLGFSHLALPLGRRWLGAGLSAAHARPTPQLYQQIVATANV